VRSHEEWSQGNWHKVGNDMFQPVIVDSNDGNWCSPFVVDLMEVFVKLWMMPKSVENYEKIVED